MADGGIYRGSREQGADYFDDVMGDNETPEMFRTAMGGIGEYEGVKTSASPQGILITMHCRPPGCGKPRQALVTWGELFVIAHAPQTNILPSGWRISEVNHAPVPELQCNCGQPFQPVCPPDWAYRQVNLALQGNVITQQQLLADPVVRQVQGSMQQAQQQQQPQGGVQLPQQMPPGGWHGPR
jgi:hypothetical protein